MSREEGLPAKKIAEELGITEQVVRNQLSAAMKKIREFLLRYVPVLIVIFKLLDSLPILLLHN